MLKNNPFTLATKEDARLRFAICGPSGSGKTMSALKIALALAGSGRVALIDTEAGSASKYADMFTFDQVQPISFEPATFITYINAAVSNGYSVIVIDSLSHAWFGKGGELEMADQAAVRSGSGNSYFAWRDVTPEHHKLVDALIRSDIHIIITMRVKTDTVLEEYFDSQGAKKTRPVKKGLKPIMREGLEYEFDVVADMDLDHNLIISKTRCSDLDGKTFKNPGEEVATVLQEWLKGEKYTEDERKAFHATGNELYGSRWAEVRPKLVNHHTRGRTKTSTQLTRKEMLTLTEGMKEQIAKKIQQEEGLIVPAEQPE